MVMLCSFLYNFRAVVTSLLMDAIYGSEAHSPVHTPLSPLTLSRSSVQRSRSAFQSLSRTISALTDTSRVPQCALRVWKTVPWTTKTHSTCLDESDSGVWSTRSTLTTCFTYSTIVSDNEVSCSHNITKPCSESVKRTQWHTGIASAWRSQGPIFS